MHINVLKRFNQFLEKDYLVAYSLDTLSFYAGKKAPPQKVKNIAFNFNYCYNNAIVICPMTIALIPFKINVTYNDTALKNMYLVVSKNRSRTFTVNGATFRLFQNKISPVFNRYNTKFKVTEAAIIHTNKIENGIRTKSTYSMGDTIFTKASRIVLDSIDEVGHLLYYTSLPVNSTSNIVSLPEKYLKDLNPFFRPNRQYMVLDFWGTWCAPCIAGLPDLKRLYNQTKAKADFLSICFDTEDKLPLAKKIFKKHSIEWATILNDQKKPTLTNFLQISSFPTYVVISKKGEVIYKNTGPEGFDNLKALLNRL